MLKQRLAAVAVCGLLGAACASSEAPRARLASARAALRSADELGAEKVPKAQLHMQLAHENIARAESMMQEGNNESATYALMRAQSDAELALSLAREEPSKREAQAALEKVSRLKPSPADSAANDASATDADDVKSEPPAQPASQSMPEAQPASSASGK